MSGRYEDPDQRPVDWPLNLKRPLTIQEEIQRFVRVEMSQRAQEHGHESFEEADDFDVEDEDEWQSPYELMEMQEERPIPAEPVVAAQQKEETSSGVSPSDEKPSSVLPTGDPSSGPTPSTIPKT